MTNKDPEGRRNPKVDLQGKYLASHRQCTARSKRTGERCRRWASLGMTVCVVHGAATRRAKTAAARRIAEASGFAADMLVEFMADPEVDLKTRTQIAQDLLNRAGLSGKTEIELSATLSVPEWEAKMMSHVRPVIVTTPDDPDGKKALAEVQRRQLAQSEYGQRTGAYGEAAASVRLRKVYPTVQDDDVIDAEVIEDDEADRTLDISERDAMRAAERAERKARQPAEPRRRPRPAGAATPPAEPSAATPDWYADPPTRTSDAEWAERGRAEARRSATPNGKRKPGQKRR